MAPAPTITDRFTTLDPAGAAWLTKHADALAPDDSTLVSAAATAVVDGYNSTLVSALRTLAASTRAHARTLVVEGEDPYTCLRRGRVLTDLAEAVAADEAPST